VKLVGNMIGILLMLIVMEKSARNGLFNARTINLLVLFSLGLGVVQTYYFGGAAYGFDGPGQPVRFSSFVAAQQYAAFLVAFFAAVLWQLESSLRVRIPLCAAICAALALNESRTWFFGAVLVLAVYLCLSFRRVFATTAFVFAAATLFVLLVLNFSPLQMDVVGDTSSRIAATLTAILTGEDTSNHVGLANLNFRLAIYEDSFQDLRTSSARELLLGHGTSSGGNVILRVYPGAYKPDRLDPNRAIHNEWIRALYEWGILGLSLLTAAFTALVFGLISNYRSEGGKTRTSAVISFMPAFLIAFSTENILAGAGNAVTMSLAVILALPWSSGHSRAARRDAHA
jgi:hypothetical protein